jgi:transposase
MIRYVGLDVHKRVVEACILDEAGKVLSRRRFDLSRERLLAFAEVSLGREDRVALEATTNTWAVVRLLKPLVAEVVVSNPMQTKAIATAKVKTDKVDAHVLAQLLRCDFLPRVWEPDEATQQLRRLTNRRAALVADRTCVKNRLHSVLAMRLILPPVEDLFGTKGRTWLQGVALDADGRSALDSDLRLLAQIEAEIEGLETLLAQRGYPDARVRLLMTLPGVGFTVAQTVLAALGDIGRFRDGDQAAAYLGLVPSTRQSAQHCYHGPITKHGNGHARWVMVQAAQHVSQHPGPLGVFFRRLAKKKSRNVAVVATARKLVVIAWHMLTKNEPYRYAQSLPTETKLQRLRVQATGERRKTGPAKGSSGSKLAGGGKTRTIKPLAQVCQQEGLPSPKAPPPGEARTVAESGTQEYVASLAAAHVVPKPRRQPAAPEVNGQRSDPEASCPDVAASMPARIFQA